MSKIGEKSITIPAGVTIDIQKEKITVKGKNGQMDFQLPQGITVSQSENGLSVKREREGKKIKSMHGLYRSLIANAVQGVENVWEKKLELVGTGYNVKMQGEDLVFKVGYSHLVVFKKIDGISFKVDGNNKLTVVGFDKYLVGEIAHKIRSIKKPDVYKGKGIKYEGEVLQIKPGKKAKTAE